MAAPLDLPGVSGLFQTSKALPRQSSWVFQAILAALCWSARYSGTGASTQTCGGSTAVSRGEGRDGKHTVHSKYCTTHAFAGANKMNRGDALHTRYRRYNDEEKDKTTESWNKINKILQCDPSPPRSGFLTLERVNQKPKGSFVGHCLVGWVARRLCAAHL